MRPEPRISFAAALIALALTTACGSAAASKPVGSSGAQLKFGVDMARRELWSEALFRFRRAAELEPANARVYNNLAVACEATGRFDEALENYRQGLKLEPDNRVLRGNYSRFVEFYRGFKPETPAEGEASAEAAGPGPAEPTAEPPAEPPVEPDAPRPDAPAPDVPASGGDDAAGGR